MKYEQQAKNASYQKMVERISPKSEKAGSLLKAFLVGGLICVVGQALTELALAVFHLEESDAGLFSTIVLVFLGSTLTGIGVYDKIGRFAGAGSIVPITGFANSIVAPAMEFKREGFITGVGAKMFTLAGPVIVYGTIASIVVGLFAFFFGGMV